MKKFILTLLLFVTIGFTYSFSTTEVRITQSIKSSIENSVCKYGQCSGKAKSTGSRCKHCVSKSGDSYCWQHK